MPDHRIRPYAAPDQEAVRALNAANVPLVGPLTDPRLALFAHDAQVTFDVATDATDAVVGLFVGMPQGVAYDSPNYHWFAARHERFHYVDRIALAPEARGTGLAARLYERWVAAASAAGAPVVCAEVNVEPPNRRSLAFHATQGFVEVGRTAPYGDQGEVLAMLELRLPPAT